MRDPEKFYAWQQRSRKPLKRTPLAKVGRKARREMEALAYFRSQVRTRAGGMCELRTPDCPTHEHPGAHAHHIAPADRDRGVHDPARGLFACAPGHSWVHANPEQARRRGLLMESWEASA